MVSSLTVCSCCVDSQCQFLHVEKLIHYKNCWADLRGWTLTSQVTSSGGNLWCHTLTLLMNWGFPWVKGNRKKFSIIFHQLYLAKSLCKSVANSLNLDLKLARSSCQLVILGECSGTWRSKERRLSRAVQQPQWFWLRFHIHTCCYFIHRALECLIVTFASLIVNLKLATLSDLQVSGITFEHRAPPELHHLWAPVRNQNHVSISWVGWAWRVCFQLGALWSPGPHVLQEDF